jgi:hypothetical protein
MRTDPQIASRFESCALPSWTANEDLRIFLAGPDWTPIRVFHSTAHKLLTEIVGIIDAKY